MQFDLTKFLVCRAIAENVDPDTPGANRLALAASLLNMGLAQSAVLASVLAAGQAPRAQGVARGRWRGRRAGAPTAKVKVPNVHHMSDPRQIHDHLREHKLQSRIDIEAMAEIKSPRVLRQWPEADADVDEGAEINVLLLTPENGRHGDAERRATRK